MRAAILGGAGFIGSALCNRLLDDGHEVTCFDDMSRGDAKRLHIGIRTIQGDVRDAGAVSQAIKDCDSVIHLAMVQGTQNFTENPWLTQEVAVWGTLNVLHAMEEHGVRDLTLLSSSEAYQGERDKVPTDESVWLSVPDVFNPRFSYGGGKIAMEMLCSAFAPEHLDRLVIARPHNIVGPDMGREHVLPQFALRMRDLATATKSGSVISFPILGTGQETRALCFIDDCIDALALLLEKGETGIYHVGTQDERSVSEMAHAVGQCFGRTIEVQPGELPKGSPPRRCPDITKISGLGYRPKTDFHAAIRKTVEFYKYAGPVLVHG